VYVCIDTLFAVFEDGAIVKVDTSTNPCTVVAEWLCDSKHSQQTSDFAYLLITFTDVCTILGVLACSGGASSLSLPLW